MSLKHFDNSKEVFTYNPFFVKRTTTAIVITFITKTYFMFGSLTHRFISFATHVKFIIYHVCCNFRLLLQKIQNIPFRSILPILLYFLLIFLETRGRLDVKVYLLLIMLWKEVFDRTWRLHLKCSSYIQPIHHFSDLCSDFFVTLFVLHIIRSFG